MKFFKHFTDARRGKSLRAIRREHGMAGVGAYWQLVEACAEKLEKLPEDEYTEEHCVFDFDLTILSECLGVKSCRVEVILRSFSSHSLLYFSKDDFIIKIEMPKLLECLDRDTKRARTVRAASAPKRKRKNKEKEEEKEKDICSEPSSLVPALSPTVLKTFSIKISSEQSVEINRELISVWAETYPKEFLDEELKKARAWILSNPHKAPKSQWGRFFNAWFARGWEKYRTTLKSNPQRISVEDLDELLGAA